MVYYFKSQLEADSFFANTLCGMQINGTKGDRLIGASRTVAGTCEICKNDTYAVDGASNCLANTVCGMKFNRTPH